MENESNILGLNFQEAERQPNPSEYRGADGLIYCEVCGQPVQCRLTEERFKDSPSIQHLKENNPEKYEEWKKQWLGVFPIYCRCGDERYKRIQKLQQQQERNKKRAEQEQKGMRDAVIKACTFDADKLQSRKVNQQAKRYADKFGNGSEVYSLFFYGESNTGKSYTAYCIANALSERGLYVYCTTVQRLLEDMRRDQAECLTEIRKANLFILDGLESVTMLEHLHEAECIYTAINTRQNAMKSMIVTSQKTRAQVKVPSAIRIYDKTESFVRMKFEGKAYQTPNYSQQELNSFLGDAVTI